MSFDSTFDYSRSVSTISGVLQQIQTELDTCNSNLALFQSVIGYPNLVSPQIAFLIDTKTYLETRKAVLQDIQNEISNLLAASDTDKDTLYQNFLILNVDKLDYMRRMLFNFETGLQDPDLLQLLADTTNTSEAKTALAQILYNKYQIDSRYSIGINFVVL